jgi:hypothetical protein
VSLTFVKLEPEARTAVAVTEAACITIPNQRAQFNRVRVGTAEVPDCVVFTPHGMACSTCM